MMSDDSNRPERRRVMPRRRVLKSARIAFNNNSSTLDCTVRNLTELGAMLEFDSVLGIPDDFALIVGSERARPCRVVHRQGARIGVEFT